MSENDARLLTGSVSFENEGGQNVFIEAIAQSLTRLLRQQYRRACRDRLPVGVFVHMVGVHLLEIEAVARGNGKGSEPGNGTSMPRFVDVKLSAEQREVFATSSWTEADVVVELTRLVSSGYRVGCSWSSEHQSYTVSLTCRAPGDENNGLCMTSFAGNLVTALALAVYKHWTVSGGVWLTAADQALGGFG